MHFPFIFQFKFEIITMREKNGLKEIKIEFLN